MKQDKSIQQSKRARCKSTDEC